MTPALAADIRFMTESKLSLITTGEKLDGRVFSWAHRAPRPTATPAVRIER